MLSRVKSDQRMARREGWMDNLAAALMGSRPMRKRSSTMAVSRSAIKGKEFEKSGLVEYFLLDTEKGTYFSHGSFSSVLPG